MGCNQIIRLICAIALVAIVIFKPLSQTQKIAVVGLAIVLAATYVIERKFFTEDKKV